MAVYCVICKNTFSTQSNLNKHRKSVHNLQSLGVSYDKNVWAHKCLENNCNNSFRRNKDLLNHLKEMHTIVIPIEYLEFQSKTEFREWKNEVEINEKVNFVLARGKRTKTENISLYICNRSGKAKTTGANKRVTKSQGSCKINMSCTCEIKVVEKKTIIVTYVNGHYGHRAQVEHIRLSQNSRDMVATKLMMGASHERILDDVRKHIGKEDFLRRIDILTKQDINNIKKSYKLEIQDGVRHANDSISIDFWVAECQKLEKNQNPVLLYKKQGVSLANFADEDFCLIVMNDFQQKMLRRFGDNIIAIDSTHGLNNYDFELTTIMTVDDFHEGFPVAFMFTNRKDTLVNTIFFQTIQSQIGFVKCKTFMSDITGTFYNAWVTVMGPVPHQLYCSWHVDRAWQNNLGKILVKEKRKIVYKTIKVLQQTLDKSAFFNLLNTAMKEMLEDKDTENFGKYFETYYLNNYTLWAYCFREKCEINTNMFLESMHKVVKYFYLGGRKVKRLDKGLHAVLNYTRDKMVDRLIKNTKGKQVNATKDIRNRHRVSITSFFTVERDENIWIVQSGENRYLIEKQLVSTNKKCCSLVCNVCEICIHAYSCTCPDSYIRSTICKHVHYISMYYSDTIQDANVQEGYFNSEKEIENEAILTSLSKNPDHKNKLKEQIITKITSLQAQIQSTNLEEVNEDILQQIKNHLTNAEHLFDLRVPLGSGAIDFKEKNLINSQQKICKQQSFFSTKKKMKSKKLLEKPNTIETKNIKRFLDGDNLDIIGEHSDHTYFNEN